MTTSPGSQEVVSPRPIRVALDVRMPAGQWGGVQQMVEGLASGLSVLSGHDEYVFIGYDDAAEWLDPLLGGPCRRVEVSRTYARSRRRRAYDAVLQRVPWAGRALAAVASRFGGLATPIAQSDGLLESMGFDVVHFVTPQAYLTEVPSVYQIMDLLHIHLPEFFSPLHRRYRETAYQVFADRASVISTMTDWSRSDIAAHMTVPLARIAAVPLPPVVTPQAFPAPHPDLPPGVGDRFVLYPAQTWPHKNHLALIEAIAQLRDTGEAIQLVCTGRTTDHHATLRRRVDALALGDQVRFLGYVDQATLAGLYARALALVFPSRFEGWGIPVVEAFAWDLPVACADIPVLAEVAGHAALRFNPTEPAAIAAAIRRVVADGELRSTLVVAGRARLEPLTWDRIARTFRSLYRRTAGVGRTDDDEALLAPPTLVA